MNLLERLKERAARPTTAYGYEMSVSISAKEASKILAAINHAKALRSAQKAYMADRGNEELGRAVGKAANEVDEALVALEENV